MDTRGRITKDGIRIYDEAGFVGMRAAGRQVAEILDMVAPLVQPGVTTAAIDDFIREEIRRRGLISATIGYKGYQHASCISINHVVCHGIPGSGIPMWKGETISKDPEKRRSNDIVKNGDIMNIDVTVIVEGWYGDSSRMYVAGAASKPAASLIKTTHESLMRGIAEVKPGASFGDIGRAIQTHVEAQRMSVVRDFCGHGLGLVFHAPPNVLHYHTRSADKIILEEGMFFTIEPMVNLGRPETRTLADDWTAVTRDKSLSAQYEHSIGVTATGCEIFTLSPAGIFFRPWDQAAA